MRYPEPGFILLKTNLKFVVRTQNELNFA